MLQPLRIPPGAKGVCGDGMGLELPRWLGLRVNVWKHEHKSGLGQQEWQGMEDVGTGWRTLGCWQPALRAGEGLDAAYLVSLRSSVPQRLMEEKNSLGRIIQSEAEGAESQREMKQG